MGTPAAEGALPADRPSRLRYQSRCSVVSVAAPATDAINTPRPKTRVNILDMMWQASLSAAPTKRVRPMVHYDAPEAAGEGSA
ncbi:hypothetical protein ACFB49_13760 [Sphingomonas sp. DBB INV C78]